MILGEVKDPYVAVWLRSYVFGGVCFTTAFKQSESKSKTYRSLDTEQIARGLTELLLRKAADDDERHNPWTCITISIKGENDYSVELRNEDPETMDMHQLTTAWMKTDLSGLKFIPDE